jgi:hypothetical protein
MLHCGILYAMTFLQRYEFCIGWIVSHCGGSDKFAHVFFGLGLWLIFALVLRRPLRSPIPLAGVLALELVNECVDRIAYHSWRLPDTLGDIAATLFWPSVLTLLLRARPALRA